MIHINQDLRLIYNYFRSALENRLEEKFHVAPIDCGRGKTEVIAAFLSNWKKHHFLPDNGALVAVKTVAEIEPLVVRAGLAETDYAVRTKQDAANSKGLGIDFSDKAPILFTTHAMIQRRLSKKIFGSAQEFNYHGGKRALRIIDEGILPAQDISIRVDDISGIVGPFRPVNPDYAEALEQFVDMVKAGVGREVIIPDSLKKLPSGLEGGQGVVRATLHPHQRDLVRLLSQAAGRSLLRFDGKKYGQQLVGAGAELPADLAPAFILDASARVKSTYGLWAKKRGNLVMLPPITTDYCNLTVRIEKCATGITAMKDEVARDLVLRKVAKFVNAEPGVPTLVVGMKARELDGIDIEAELNGCGGKSGYLSNPSNMAFLNWGRHRGTNKYRSYKRVVVIGGFNEPEMSYQARYMAASGEGASAVTGDEWTKIRSAELTDNLYQAICRGNVRNATNGICSEQEVYLIISQSPDPKNLIAEAFPGCKIEEVGRVDRKLSKLQQKIFDEVERQFRSEIVSLVAKFKIRKALDMQTSNFGHALNDFMLRSRLKEIGIIVLHHAFQREVLSVLADAA